MKGGDGERMLRVWSARRSDLLAQRRSNVSPAGRLQIGPAGGLR